MSKDKLEQLETLARPLIDLLREQYNPHCQIIIESDRVRIVEDVVGVPVKEDIEIKETNGDFKGLTDVTREFVVALEKFNNAIDLLEKGPIHKVNSNPVKIFVHPVTRATKDERFLGAIVTITKGTQV